MDKKNLAVQVIRNTLYDEETAEQVLSMLSNAKSPEIGISKAIILVAVPVAQEMYKEDPDIDPSIWLSDGGVLDSIIGEMIELAEASGIPIDDAEAVAQVSKQNVMKDLQASIEGQAEQPQEQTAPPQEPAQPGLIQGAM